MRKIIVLVVLLFILSSVTVFATSIINGLSSSEWNTRGQVFISNKDYDSAIISYDNAIILDPQDAKNYFDRGTAYYEKELFDIAIKDFSTAIVINPQYAEAYCYRGRAYHEKGWKAKSGYDKAISDFNMAIKDFSTAININNQYAEAYYYRGHTYTTTAIGSDKYNTQLLYERAISDFNNSIRFNPQYQKAYFSKAMYCQNLNRREEAIDAYLKFLELTPPDNGNYSYAKQQLVKLGYYRPQ